MLEIFLLPGATGYDGVFKNPGVPGWPMKWENIQNLW